MPAPSLFVGVVSHERTSYRASQGPEGLGARLAASVPGATVRVNTADLSAHIQVDSAMVQRSLSAELRAEAAWDRYLGGSAGFRLLLAARWAKRAARAFRRPPAALIRRLLDIELSHRDLWEAGLDSGAPWVVILEDDADAADDHDLAAGISSLMRQGQGVAYVNLSRSFAPDDLRIADLLLPTVPPQPWPAWGGSVPRSVLTARRPVTNTVCAIAYSASFLRDLLPVWDALPLDPVLPIDWKLNMALVRMHRAGAFPAGGCRFVEPAPIAQGSMAGAGILEP